MKIKTIDKPTLQLLAKEITEALKPLGEKYGLDIKRGNASYTVSNFVLKLEVAVINQNGQAVSKEETDFLSFANFIGLDKSDLGRSILYGSRLESYTIIGYLTHGSKYPILALNSKGQRMKLKLQPVVDACKRQKGIKAKLDDIKKEAASLSDPLVPYEMPSIDELVKLNGQEKVAMGIENNEDSRK